MSPTKLELFNELKLDIAAGRGLHDSVHLVNHDQERKRRKENKAKTTTVRFEAYSPESYSEFHMQRDRYVRLCVDPSLAIQVMLQALAAFSDEVIKDALAHGHREEPEWMRES